MFKIALDVFCGATFLVMVFRDDEWKRMFYFAAYVVYTGIIVVVHLIFTFWDRDEEKTTEKSCAEIELN